MAASRGTRQVLTALALTGLLLGVGLWAGGKTAEAEVIPAYAELQKFCTKLVQTPGAVLQDFTLNPDKGTVTYYSGDVIVNSDAGGVCNDPLGVLVRTQCRIELARAYVQSEEKGGPTHANELVGSAIVEAEKLVVGGLKTLRASRHSHEVRLRGAYVVLWRVEGIFLEKVRGWVDSKGMTMQTLCEQRGTCQDPCGSPNVPLARVTTTPTEATILYIPAFDWDLAVLRKVDPRPAMRQAFRSPLEVLAGTYVVKVEWPDGTTWGPERRNVTGSLTIECPE